ncbi:cyclin-dependent kinase inhibitor 1B-like [Stigmatopora argus]
MCNKMSDVRLSNASPPLGRGDPRQQDRVRPPVCRNLFGKPDQAEIDARLTATLREDVRSFEDRYNFDPVEDRPLPGGDFVWTQARDAPEFYSRPSHERLGEPSRSYSEGAQRSLNTESSKKRASDAAGSPSECPKKRSHSRGDDDNEPPRGSGAEV